ncbi:MAG: hypothetical protein LBQ80_04840 [Clostridium sp.]|nr:hypothetical protein [Clostridium sp.]
MRYFTEELSSKEQWESAFKRWEKSIKKIECYFPADFIKALLSGDLHDSYITNFRYVSFPNSTTGFAKTADIYLELHEDCWKDKYYSLKFKNVARIKIDFVYTFTWLYAEVRRIKARKHDKTRRFALEVLGEEDNLYIEFEELIFSSQVIE